MRRLFFVLTAMSLLAVAGCPKKKEEAPKMEEVAPAAPAAPEAPAAPAAPEAPAAPAAPEAPAAQ